MVLQKNSMNMNILFEILTKSLRDRRLSAGSFNSFDDHSDLGMNFMLPNDNQSLNSIKKLHQLNVNHKFKFDAEFQFALLAFLSKFTFMNNFHSNSMLSAIANSVFNSEDILLLNYGLEFLITTLAFENYKIYLVIYESFMIVFNKLWDNIKTTKNLIPFTSAIKQAEEVRKFHETSQQMQEKSEGLENNNLKRMGDFTIKKSKQKEAIHGNACKLERKVNKFGRIIIILQQLLQTDLKLLFLKSNLTEDLLIILTQIISPNKNLLLNSCYQSLMGESDSYERFLDKKLLHKYSNIEISILKCLRNLCSLSNSSIERGIIFISL